VTESWIGCDGMNCRLPHEPVQWKDVVVAVLNHQRLKFKAPSCARAHWWLNSIMCSSVRRQSVEVRAGSDIKMGRTAVCGTSEYYNV